MTVAALDAAGTNTAQIAQLISSLGEDDWQRASACPGWRVIDMIAHLGAVASSIVAPTPPDPDDPPLPAERERQHDVLVDRRRAWPLERVLDEWRTNTPKLLDVLAGMQHGEARDTTITLPGLGTYPQHMLANALAFDTYCHLRNDLVQPGGPLRFPLPDPTDELVRPAVEWMIAGLPQMQGTELAATVTEPIVVELDGPGETVFTVHPAAGPGDLLRVTPDAAGDVRVTSSAIAFIRWGTSRDPWSDHCTVHGDITAARPFLDKLDII
ncbi:maleylpyruvate isomerase family mycothiol-dependent enzyme [Pseudonocardia spinosispora]|uniref:maleylpyruvate isomerase family mycothiol-dependent enzyme n=1 Tax=Pseudonocardia spinosispora TaxID=103441 RepID=UPI000400691E|nr:maleylpyruvate isomerase family mycothiol-dependent enzyme [Pseudonocardia spinosispora]